MISNAYRASWKIALVFVLVFVTLSTGSNTTRSAHAAASEPYIGEIQLFPYNYAPNGWVFAAGQTMNISQNQALFALLGTQYGGDGRTTFNLPDLTSLSVPDGMGYYIAINGIFPSRGDLSTDSNVQALAGEVRLFPYSYTPSGWARLDGSVLQKSQFPLLYSVLGPQSDTSSQTFQLPTINNPLPGQQPFFAIALSSSNPNQQGRDIGDGTGNEFVGETIPFVVPMQTQAYPTDGRTLNISENQALFALISNKFGGDGVQRFQLPNLTSNPYSFYYYTFSNGLYPSYGSSGSAPSSLAGTNAIATVGSGRTQEYSKTDLLSSSNGTGVSIRTQPLHGTVTDTGSRLIYTAPASYAGADQFTIRTYNANGFAIGYSTIKVNVELSQPPAITGVSDGGVYNHPVTPVISSGLATLNGQPFTSGTPITTDGSYTLLATNNYGFQQITFTVDATPPVVSGVTNGGRYTVPPTISFNEGTAKLNGMAFTSGGTISQEGNYTLIVTDTANNSSTITFSYYAPRLLSFNSNGGTSVATQTLYYGDVGVEPVKPTRTGYTFTGWYRDAALTQLFHFASTAITANTQLYAGWSMNQYVVSFDSNGGTAVASVVVNYGAALNAPTEPTRTGYSFTGWYTDAAHTQRFDFANTTITADLHLYAGWNINQYTVSFDSGGGTAIADRVIDYYTLLSEPTAPTRTGYTFNGWYRDAAHTQRFDFTATPVTANMQLYADWTLQSYTVTFDVYSGANMPNQTIPYGTLITRPADPVQAGHTFTGWYRDAAHTQPFDFQTVITTPVTVYAGWSVNQYTVSFNSNGGTAVSQQALNYGSLLAEPMQPTRTGYTFTGWYRDAELQQRFDFVSSVIRDDMQLYAGWERNQYTVGFDTYGGSVIQDVYIGYGDLLTIPNTPTADDAGSVFAGWFADPQHNLPFDFSQPIISNIMIYAKWAVRVQQITFDTDGGTAIAAQSAAYGDLLSRPADPQRAGYTFAGWYADAAHTQSFDFATDRVTTDLTLYAKWTITIHTVTFDVDGGTTVPTQTVNDGATLSRPTDPTRSGYTFNGWYSDIARSQRFDFAKATVTSDMTLYAGWTQISESSSGNGRSGGSTSSNTSTTQAQVTIPVGQAGELRIGSGVWLQVPAGAADQALEIKASMMTTPPTGLGSDQRVVSPVYEFLKNMQGTFKIPVKLTLSFDPSTLRSDEKLAVFYQAQANTPWTMVEDSTVNGNTISASVNHFTRFTVMAVPVTTTTPTTPSTGGGSDTAPAEVSTTFSDITNHWAAESIREAAALGIVKGYADGTFHPGAQVTRAEFTVMLIRMLKPATPAGSSTLPAFTDSHQIGAWARDDIATASALGWVKGNADGGFRPNASITRAEMAVMVSRALALTSATSNVSFTDAATIPTWAKEAAAHMQQAGWMNGRTNGDFDPSAVTTRAEAAQVLMRAHQQ